MRNLYIVLLAFLVSVSTAHAVDITTLPPLGTATATDKIVSYKSSAVEGERVAGFFFKGLPGWFLDGQGGWQAISVENTMEWVFTDMTGVSLSPWKWLRVPSNSSFGNAYIKCNANEGITPVEFDLYLLDSISDTSETKLTAATSELTMSLVASYVDAIDLSGFVDLDKGDYVNLRVSVIADTAAVCTVTIELIGR